VTAVGLPGPRPPSAPAATRNPRHLRASGPDGVERLRHGIAPAAADAAHGRLQSGHAAEMRGHPIEPRVGAQCRNVKRAATAAPDPDDEPRLLIQCQGL